MKILLALDGSDQSREACRYLIEHRDNFGKDSQVTLMHVATPLPADIEMALGTTGDGSLARYYEESHESALSEAGSQLDKAGISYTKETALGPPGPTLARFAERQAMDLVIMGSHGRGALGSLVLGSVTARVLASCKVPVLIIR
ncbi:universal stress protein [Oleiagrimonas sp. C23AA]|uniref:universal stress protein n=1 Tax=Oleiagrimonas sp. C23AA TaxID=2719047 RepID=UPI0014205DE9|nr:universal stress protein [Oleiagrimonas sp. C23AA]NII09742.1 universal stress protein [Oleiagrimonas sp. C23AA]